MNLGVHIPCYRRLALLDVVLRNLQKVGEEIRPHQLVVSVVGSEGAASKQVAERCGADYTEAPNEPLGAKVNAAVRRLKKYDVDGVVGVGSDDLVSKELFLKWVELLKDGVDYMGTRDLYCLHLQKCNMVYWPGYKNHRVGESIGVGRCLSRRLMERLDWAPFESSYQCNLDWSMTQKLEDFEYRSESLLLTDIDAFMVDVKTTQYINPMPSYGEKVPDCKTVIADRLGDDIMQALYRVEP